MSCLMISTIEPRKGYCQTLHAFEYLWVNGLYGNLIIVGNVGWKILSKNWIAILKGITDYFGFLR